MHASLLTSSRGPSHLKILYDLSAGDSYSLQANKPIYTSYRLFGTGDPIVSVSTGEEYFVISVF